MLLFPLDLYAADTSGSTPTTSWFGGAEEATIIIEEEGLYDIKLMGEKGGNAGSYSMGVGGIGGFGGSLTGRFHLKSNDILYIKLLDGGVGHISATAWSGDGGKAVYTSLNNVDNIIIGAGGGGGVTYWGTGYHTDRVDNLYFSSGGGGASGDSVAAGGLPGNTIDGCIPAEGFNDHPTRKRFGHAGQNYLDSSGYLVEQPNNSSVLSWSIRLADESSPFISLQSLHQRFDSLESKIEEPTTSSAIVELPPETINVTMGKPFSITLVQYGNLDSDTSGGVSLINTDKTDRVVYLTGTLNNEGYVTIELSGQIFLFNVIKEPNSHTIQPLFLN